MNGMSPRERLKALRARTGMTGDEVAQGCAFKGRNAYLRYEQENQQGDKDIPYSLIAKLLPLWVGKGEPPITVNDLMAISDKQSSAPMLLNRLERVASLKSSPMVVLTEGLPIRYTIEDGIYLSQDRLRDISRCEVSPNGSADDEADQFAVLMKDGSTPQFPAGSLLRCTRRVMPGKHVIVAVEVVGAPDICSLEGCRKSSDGQLMSLRGGRVSGTHLGSVVGIYREL